jgi:hypothetical protein
MLQLFPGRRRGYPVLVVAMAVAVLSAANPRAAVDAYKNYTVGDDKGWYDGLPVDYQAWAEGYNFSLGDFLSEYHTHSFLLSSIDLSNWTGNQLCFLIHFMFSIMTIFMAHDPCG